MTHEHDQPNEVDEPKALKHPVVDGYTVFWWPEFQALAKRLMIDLEAPITELDIHLPMDNLVRITIKTNALDANSKR